MSLFRLSLPAASMFIRKGGPICVSTAGTDIMSDPRKSLQCVCCGRVLPRTFRITFHMKTCATVIPLNRLKTACHVEPGFTNVHCVERPCREPNL